MRHTRPDYQPIQYLDVEGIPNPIEDDEPVVVIRAKQRNAPEICENIASDAERDGCLDVAASMRETADLMREWQRANPDKVKKPDLPVAV